MNEQQKNNEILNNPDLLKLIINEIHKKIVGEDIAIKTGLIMASGMFVNNANLSSYNLIINSNSGAGKSYILKKVTEIFPKSMVEYKTKISEKAFIYWHNHKAEPNWTWDGKICFLEDVSNDLINCDTFKIMASEGSCATIVIDHKAVEIEIKGKPVLFLTIANLDLNNELLRRMAVINLNESDEQTKAILEWQAEVATNNERQGYDKEFIEALGLLERVNVVVPFSGMLTEAFPKQTLIARTHFSRMLDLIKASAALHQNQREWINDNTITATWEDFDNIREVMVAITTNTKLISLSKKQKQIVEACKNQGEWFSVSELMQKNPGLLSQSKWYTSTSKLFELGLLELREERIDGNKKPTTFYKLKDLITFKLPTSYELKEGMFKSEDINSLNYPNSLNFCVPSTTPNFTKIFQKCERCGINPENGNYLVPGNKWLPGEHALCEQCLKLEWVEEEEVKDN